MTGADSQNIQNVSVLLPEARVDMFSKDENSLAVSQSLAQDWRFARVGVAAHNGDVEAAIAHYSAHESPDLILIQTDTIDESFTERLGALAEYCSERTSAIVIGPDNDVNLYRQLIDMGVSDYLVRPVQAPVLAEVIAKSLIEKIGVTGSSLVALIGAKGGVGTSVLAEALACGAADIAQKKTLLLDTAGGWSTLSVGMGFEPTTTLAEAVKAAENDDEDNLMRMLHEADARLSVLATGGDVMLENTVLPEQLEALLDMVMARFPVVVSDVSQSSEALQKIVLNRASKIILVSTATLPALRLARTLLHEIKEIRGGDADDIQLLINMQGLAAKNEVSKADIEAAMEMDVAAFVPFEPAVFLGNESESKKLTEDKDGRAIIEENLLPLIGLSGPATMQKSKDGGLLDGFLSKLSPKG